MSKAKESVLTPAEKASISIEHFIFHIIIADAEEPNYLTEVLLTDTQRGFFCQRLAQAAEGSQYLFTDKNASTPARCSRILDNPDTSFLEESKGLTQDFLNHHKRNFSSGVFVVALIHITRNNETIPLISLLKMDHAKVYEYLTEETDEGLVAKLQEVMNTFVEDKAALQKVALIDVNDNYSWDILAKQRHSTDHVADYFQGFLSAKERQDASYWTRQAFGAVARWAIENKNDLPEDQDPSSYKLRAIQYMESHGEYTTDGFIDMVILDENQERAEKFRESLGTRLAESGVAGQTFPPKPGSLKSSVVKNRRITKEGVSVEWEGDAKTAGISFENTHDGRERIIIETHGFSQES